MMKKIQIRKIVVKVGLRTFHEGLESEHKICSKKREHTRFKIYVPEEEEYEQKDMYVYVTIFANRKREEEAAKR